MGLGQVGLAIWRSPLVRPKFSLGALLSVVTGLAIGMGLLWHSLPWLNRLSLQDVLLVVAGSAAAVLVMVLFLVQKR